MNALPKMIQLNCVSKSYNGLPVIKRLSLNVNRGEVVGLVGPSGAGKTTLLRLIAGLTLPDTGTVSVDSARISYVFQEARLLPWRTTVANVAVALRANGTDRQVSHRLAEEWLRQVGLADFQHHYPAQLSGGMQQRVALARAFAVQPDILLLDEPFSHLDDGYKQELLAILSALIESTGVTVMYVTHTVAELDGLAGRILRLTSHGSLN